MGARTFVFDQGRAEAIGPGMGALTARRPGATTLALDRALRLRVGDRDGVALAPRLVGAAAERQHQARNLVDDGDDVAAGDDLGLGEIAGADDGAGRQGAPGDAAGEDSVLGLDVLRHGLANPALDRDVGGLDRLAPAEGAVEDGDLDEFHERARDPGRCPTLARTGADRHEGRDAAAAAVVDHFLDGDGCLHVGRDHEGGMTLEDDRERCVIDAVLRLELLLHRGLDLRRADPPRGAGDA